MTNTLHRLGDPEDRLDDFVIVCTTAVGINSEGCAGAKRRFLQIALKHDPVNVGAVEEEPVPLHRWPREMHRVEDSSTLAVVFDDPGKLQRALRDVAAADLGLCINVSGIAHAVDQCCRYAGITRHSVENSLGIKGQTDLLPPRSMLEIASLCGHGMVSYNLITRVLELVKKERMSLTKASEVLCRPCACGVVNPSRAERLLRGLMDVTGNTNWAAS